jgi:phosphoribosylanthranilate isomerase
MENIKLKVCGMREASNVLEVSELRPDYMGFIFYSASPRYVGDHFQMPEALSPETKRVGVFVNESTEVIIRKITDFRLDYIQLHGDEPAEQCRELRKYSGIIKAFSVDENMDFAATNPYREEVDFFLFDTKGKYYGGNARAFDWDILRKFDQKVPFFLSGGLNADNMGSVGKLSGLNLHAIDINSGVEVKPALKDLNKIRAIKEILKAKTLNA